eukprot:sb/3462443/
MSTKTVVPYSTTNIHLPPLVFPTIRHRKGYVDGVKGITHWRHPFSDGFYNPFSKEIESTPTSTPRGVDGSAGYTLRDGPIRSPSTTPTSTRTGWCGYLAGALFLLLITSLLTILLVPFSGIHHPASTSTQGGSTTTESNVDMFSYLEEQRVLAGKLEKLEATTAQQLALIQKLQEEGDVEGQLVKLRSVTDKHSTDLGGIAATIAAYHASVKTLESGQTTLRSDYTSLASKLSSLTSTAASKDEEGQTALKEAQVAMAGQVESLRTVITVLTSSVDNVGKRHDELLKSQKVTESDLQRMTADITTLDNSIKGLSGGLTDKEREMAVTIEGLSRNIDTLQRDIKGLKGERPSLVQAAAVEDKLTILRKELLVVISNAQLAAASGNDDVLTSRLTELKSLMKEQEDAGQAVRASLSAAEQRIRALEGKDTDLRIDQLTRARDETNSQIVDLRSKLDVLSRSGKDSEERATANIRELKALIETAKSEAAKQTRQVVLSVLSDVTRESSETRYFSEWLISRFLLKEELSYQREPATPHTVVANETILPSQDELIQVILAELRSKHQIDLRPETGVTLSDIRVIVSDALQTFDEDKTGRADFALEALGGSILSTGCTGERTEETYYEGAPYASFMSVPLYRVPNPPNVALQPGITPGQCWAFKGTEGYMMIKVRQSVGKCCAVTPPQGNYTVYLETAKPGIYRTLYQIAPEPARSAPSLLYILFNYFSLLLSLIIITLS